MESRDHQRLLVAALSSFIFFTFADCIEESGSIPPNLQPVSAPVYPPASESSPPSSSISFPSSVSDPPSESISPSGSNFPSQVDSPNSDPPSEAFDADPPSESISPSGSNFPSGVDSSYSDSPSEAFDADPPSESISPSGSNFPSVVDSSYSDPPSEAFDADPPLESISPSANIDTSVKKICDSTDYPSLCLATVVPLLNGNTDVLSVLEVAMHATNKLATFAVSVLKKFAERPGIPPEIVENLKGCEDSFDTVLYNFERALNAFGARDIGTMNTMLSAVITDIGDCEDAFSQSGSTSPVFRYTDRLTNMTSNCLAIVSLIK